MKTALKNADFLQIENKQMKRLVLTGLLVLCFLIPHAKENGSAMAGSAEIGQAINSKLNPTEGGTYSISANDGKVVLNAGIMQRILHVSEGGVFTTHLTVDNESLLSQITEEVSFRISRAVPNREPGTLNTKNGGAINLEETEKGG